MSLEEDEARKARPYRDRSQGTTYDGNYGSWWYEIDSAEQPQRQPDPDFVPKELKKTAIDLGVGVLLKMIVEPEKQMARGGKCPHYLIFQDSKILSSDFERVLVALHATGVSDIQICTRKGKVALRYMNIPKSSVHREVGVVL